MLSNEEATRVYTDLFAILGELGLGWIGTQIEQQIRYGNTQQDIRVNVYRNTKSKDGFYTVEPSKAGARFQATEDFTAREQLALLVSALKTVAAQSIEIEQEVASFFDRDFQGTERNSPIALQFYDDNQRLVSSLTIPELENRRNNLLELTRLLDELNREI